MTKIYGGFREGSRDYEYTANESELVCVRNSIQVEDVEKGLFFMRNYFKKNLPNQPNYSWDFIFSSGLTVERMETLISLINAPVEEVVKEEKVVDQHELVLCSCGCFCEKHLVMSTSTGTSCPDCYDKMSL